MVTRIAEKIKELRQRRSLTQVQLAKILGTSRSYVCHLEEGSFQPSLKLALKIDLGLNLSEREVSKILFEEKEKQAIEELKKSLQS